MERSVKNQNMIPSKSIDTAIIIENKDRLILFVSDTISELFQIPLKPKDLVGLSIIQFFQSNSLLFVNESYERLLVLL